MENQTDEVKKSQANLNNPEQGDRSQATQEQLTKRADDAGYTAQENQFADGKGTQLNEELTPSGGDIEDDISQQDETSQTDTKIEDEDLDRDFENFKKNNA